MATRKKKMRKTLALIAAILFCPAFAKAATTILLTTTTYNGTGLLDTSAPISNALPSYGPYIFTISLAPATAGGNITSFSAYLQQKGLSGSLYTIANSTFTTCNAACTQSIVTDVYNGGTIVPRWTITSGSATVTFSAVNVTP